MAVVAFRRTLIRMLETGGVLYTSFKYGHGEREHRGRRSAIHGLSNRDDFAVSRLGQSLFVEKSLEKMQDARLIFLGMVRIKIFMGRVGQNPERLGRLRLGIQRLGLVQRGVLIPAARDDQDGSAELLNALHRPQRRRGHAQPGLQLPDEPGGDPRRQRAQPHRQTVLNGAVNPGIHGFQHHGVKPARWIPQQHGRAAQGDAGAGGRAGGGADTGAVEEVFVNKGSARDTCKFLSHNSSSSYNSL